MREGPRTGRFTSGPKEAHKSAWKAKKVNSKAVELRVLAALIQGEGGEGWDGVPERAEFAKYLQGLNATAEKIAKLHQDLRASIESGKMD